ncbi:hypothetical protein E3O68_15450 [Cryobacterium sp. TMB3-1-2]|nr:hypothetical protein E3O68_15450 [Cryobacterium sp. TMB3-1-2]TFC60922.1 hypothetical protein E3O60_06435 [Cryobacterium sp. TMB1-7]TFC66098.1 hypothetical protein E3T21_18820 [Cryobacterium sp. TMB3-15]TFC78619.1 hypothetical protein E3T22_03940 [Cryobacterium sp. TMB3-10]TFC87675.1 hypothetical protein E3T19_11745 [Cryobacterium sp. TMT4-31]TFD40305.1 hypothetical protein E3T58_13810 [Cryobacterium sp. TMB3-12]
MPAVHAARGDPALPGPAAAPGGPERTGRPGAGNPHRGKLRVDLQPRALPVPGQRAGDPDRPWLPQVRPECAGPGSPVRGRRAVHEARAEDAHVAGGTEAADAAG